MVVHGFLVFSSVWSQGILGQPEKEKSNVLLYIKRSMTVPFVSDFVIQLYQ